jgi:hypothetical protein
MENVIIKAEHEIRRLKADAAAIEFKINKLESFIATYNEIARSSGNLFDDKQLNLIGETPLQNELSGTRKGSKASDVVYAVTGILADGEARPTRVLLRMLKTRGLAFSGSDEAQTLSIQLSTSGKFQSNRKLGWTLKSAEAQDAATS